MEERTVTVCEEGFADEERGSGNCPFAEDKWNGGDFEAERR